MLRARDIRSPGNAIAVAGIGFTMALFIANLAFASTSLDSAKLGILVASIVSALAALALLSAATARSGS